MSSAKELPGCQEPVILWQEIGNSPRTTRLSALHLLVPGVITTLDMKVQTTTPTSRQEVKGDYWTMLGFLPTFLAAFSGSSTTVGTWLEHACVAHLDLPILRRGDGGRCSSASHFV